MTNARKKIGLISSALLASAAFLAALPGAAQNIRPATDLPSLLKRTAEYCRKLESAVLDFVCREEINEMIDPALDAPPRPTIITWTTLEQRAFATGPLPKIKNFYVYDYQCIRSGGAISEIRTLLQENRKKKNEPNAKLKTSVFVYGTVLLGPVGILVERLQGDYDYTIAGEDMVNKKPVVIINAKPVPGAPATTNLYGKVWVDPATAEILKIEWNESRVGHNEIFEKRAESYNRKPRITIRSEFQAEKNGIRFPSKLIIEEAYLNARGRAFVRSETTVTYKDFKFFTVEVDVKSSR
jgi:hypothetical protein